MMKKNVRVKFLNANLEEEYSSLSADALLKKRIDFVIFKLKENPTFEQPIAKRLIPKEYVRQGVDNAFWVELNNWRGWRLIYNLTPENNVEIIAIILEWFVRHKEYGRRFGHEQ
jgi:hypothetical protein